MTSNLSRNLPVTLNRAIDAHSNALVEAVSCRITEAISAYFQQQFTLSCQFQNRVFSPYLITYITIGKPLVVTRDLMHKIQELDPVKMELIFEGFSEKRKLVDKIYVAINIAALPYEVGSAFMADVSQGVEYVYSNCLSLQPPRNYLPPALTSFMDGLGSGVHHIASHFFRDMVGQPAAQALQIVFTPMIKQAVEKICGCIPVFEARLNHLSREYLPPEIIMNLFFSASGNAITEITPIMAKLETDRAYLEASNHGKVVAVLKMLAAQGNVPGLIKEQINQLTEENFHEKIEEFTAAIMKKGLTETLLPMLLPPQVAAYSHFLSVMGSFGEGNDIVEETLIHSLSSLFAFLSDFDAVQNMIDKQFQSEGLDFTNDKELYESYLQHLFSEENPSLTTSSASKPGLKGQIKKDLQNHVKNKLKRLGQQPFLAIAHFYFLDAFFKYMSQVITYEEQLKSAQRGEASEPEPVRLPEASDQQIERFIEFFMTRTYTSIGGRIMSFFVKKNVGRIRKKLVATMPKTLKDGVINPMNYNLMLDNFVDHVMHMKNIPSSQKDSVTSFFSFYFSLYAQGFPPEEAQTKVMHHIHMLKEMSEENLNRYFMNKKDVHAKSSEKSKSVTVKTEKSIDIRKEIEELLEIQQQLHSEINKLNENKKENKSKIDLINQQITSNQMRIALLEKRYEAV